MGESSRPPAYVGRFAPAPTGPLHFGSAVTAIASYLQARRLGGSWQLRFEDLDTPRNVPGAGDDILSTLERLGLEWDGAVLHQSARLPLYAEALRRLQRQGDVFPCACTRREIGPGRTYPGTCRSGLPPGRTPRSLRLRVPKVKVAVADQIQPTLEQDLADAVGDFIVRRADGIVAYHLAIVVDDAWQAVSEIVRGADLWDSTPRQVYLQRRLQLPGAAYAHIPVAVDAQGRKLSKQNHAPPVDRYDAVAVWHGALNYLGQAPPAQLRCGDLQSLKSWAIANWSLKHIPRRAALPAPCIARSH